MKKEKSDKGIVLLIVILFVVILGVSTTAILKLHSMEVNLARRQNNSTRAFYLAEAGLQRALYNLDQDFKGDTTPSWVDGDIDGIDVTQGGTIVIPQNRDEAKAIDDPAQPFYSLPYSSTSLADGSYSVELLNISGKTDQIWVKSTGISGESTRTIVAHVAENNLSPWNAAIFGGAGLGGVLINGNVEIHGSVHILGEGLTPADYAIDMSGSAVVMDSYSGIPLALSSRIVAGELDTKLRVKHGLVGLSGSATVGQPGDPVDGVYVTDGYGGTKGAASVYSDNGFANSYDLGDTVTFPKISGDNPYTDLDTGNIYANYLAYAKANGLVISAAGELAELANITPVSIFEYKDLDDNKIKMDGNGNLTISGIVYIEGGDLEMKDAPGKNTIIYSGSGIIVVEGDAVLSDGEVRIETNILTAGTFPTSDVLGVITSGKLIFDEAAIDIMGAFYAETKIELKKQTDLAGTIVSNYIDMGSNVPSVYQVPSLIDNLPEGMIDLPNKWFPVMEDWQEI